MRLHWLAVAACALLGGCVPYYYGGYGYGYRYGYYPYGYSYAYPAYSYGYARPYP